MESEDRQDIAQFLAENKINLGALPLSQRGDFKEQDPETLRALAIIKKVCFIYLLITLSLEN
jgi:hypothetical protein